LPPSFRARYEEGALGEFFNLFPGDTEAALRLPREAPREALVRGLRRYAQKLGAPYSEEALEKLLHPESRVVVTGQQVGLLLGPMYTLSKAVTALTLAKSLSTEARPVVPVFWLASQDADSAEINYAHLLDLSEALHRPQLSLPEGVPAGRIAIQPAWARRVLEELRALRTPELHKGEVLELLERTAARAHTFADWFGGLLYELLGREGLLVLNPLEPDLAELFRPVLEAELRRPLGSSARINAAGERLRALGFAPQLGRGEGATNLFLEEGTRLLLRFDGGFYTETPAGTRRYRPEELLELLQREPSRLTPAAGLRPITQDAVLPTAVTVVGPGELRYFAQLRGVYEAHGVAMPLIWPRATVTVLEPPVRRILDKFGLTFRALQRDFEGVRAETLLRLHGHKEAFDESLAALEEVGAHLTHHVAGIDPTLQRTVARAQARLRAVFGTLREKSAAALTRQDHLYTAQFERLRIHLFPCGEPQERFLSPFSFFLKFGVTGVMDALLALPPTGDHELRF